MSARSVFTTPISRVRWSRCGGGGGSLFFLWGGGGGLERGADEGPCAWATVAGRGASPCRWPMPITVVRFGASSTVVTAGGGGVGINGLGAASLSTS
jgi:hypothetical protein